MVSTTLDQARAAKAKAAETFGRAASVVGVGITRIGDGFGIKVNLKEAPAADVTLPKTVDGVPVRLEIVGPIRKR